MKKTRLRTKFLISLLAVTAGLSTATLTIVSYRVKKQAREELQEDLHSSLKTYAIFEQQRNEMLSHSAALVGNLPILRALMSTEHARFREVRGEHDNPTEDRNNDKHITLRA